MKLIFAIVQKEDTKPLIRALIEHDISVTRISSVGGFLSGGNTTLMIGVETDRLQTALDVIREKSSRRHSVTVPSAGIPHPMETVAMPIQITIGGATVFIVNVDEFYRF